MGVATGITMEFQFGTNWAYYSQYVGDVFGAPLAIEGLAMAFFLEATFVGLFFFAWDRLSRVQHLVATWALALGTNFSALWILIANGWMQNPVGARFNADTMRMEVSDFMAVLFNPVAQAKFVHTVSAEVTLPGSVFVSRHKRVVSFARSARRICKTIHDGRSELWTCFGTLSRGARRRVGIHGGSQSEDEDRGDRSYVENRAGACLVQRNWSARTLQHTYHEV